jgi:hypothetical protein
MSSCLSRLTMNLTLTILYISTIAWIFPIFRQFRCNLFYFFLLLGLSDPISTVVIYVFYLRPEIIQVIIAPILFYTINIDRQKKFTINTLEIAVFLLSYILLIILNNYNIIILIIHTLITIRAIFKNIIELHLHQKINIVHLVLAFYMISSVASLIIYLNGDHNGMVLFYINLASQTLIAIFFSIFREDNPKMTYKIVPVLDD